MAQKSDLWVVFQHRKPPEQDSFRLLSRQGLVITSIDAWQRIPSGVSFHPRKDSLMQSNPPADILSSSLNGLTAPEGSDFGALMFLRSGRVGFPLPGGAPLVLKLDSISAAASPPSAILISRATGRATTQ
ncbi:MAG: hypothetical protein WCP60_01955 [bacterium]